MKWYNKSKTKFIDLDKVTHWSYISEEEQKKNVESFLKRVGSNIISTGAYLLVVVDGCETEFGGEEAEEIYNILKKRKQLI